MGELMAVLDLLRQTKGAQDDLLVPRRTTFYGADEIWVRAANGTIVGYAQASTGQDGGSAGA